MRKQRRASHAELSSVTVIQLRPWAQNENFESGDESYSDYDLQIRVVNLINFKARARVVCLNTRVTPSNTRVVPSNTRVIPSNTRVVPSNTRVVPSNTRVVPSNTRVVCPNTRVVCPNTRVVPSNTRVVPSNTRVVCLNIYEFIWKEIYIYNIFIIKMNICMNIYEWSPIFCKKCQFFRRKKIWNSLFFDHYFF